MKSSVLIILYSLAITACDAAADGESCDLSHGLPIAAPLDAPDVYFRETRLDCMMKIWSSNSAIQF